ncbi:MAG: ABC transporter ATP-binding protein [Acholeplasmatales bacterium]|nr:MAG: ABC transporter ATP-binding protein [Acholeplasmatales bacterium]
MFSVRDLRFTYPKSEIEAVQGISFDVHEGEVFGLLGPSGAGKSTTQKILTKLFRSYQGTILYNGKDLSDYRNDYYEDIGVGFELPVHFSKLTGLENMQFFAQLYKQRTAIEPLLEQVGLLEDKDRLVATYSKGMKMRLNFVRAMLNKPKVLFLDEVTNGLDPKNARILKDQIRTFKEAGGTVFLSTHLMNDVEELCDRVAFIRGGKIVETSTPRALKIKHGQRSVTVEYYENNHTQAETFDLDGLADNAAFLRLLKEKKIETMHSGETSLDEIFIKVTGVSAHEDA